MPQLEHLLAWACLALCESTDSAAQSADVFEQGKPLPDLELPTLDLRQTINLSELRGKRVLLIQFASW